MKRKLILFITLICLLILPTQAYADNITQDATDEATLLEVEATAVTSSDTIEEDLILDADPEINEEPLLSAPSTGEPYAEIAIAESAEETLDAETPNTSIAGVKPGSVFHTFDRFFEKVRMALIFDDEKKLEYKIRIAEERSAEAQELMAEGQIEEAEEAAELFAKEIEQAQEESTRLMTGTPTKSQEKIFERMSRISNEVIDTEGMSEEIAQKIHQVSENASFVANAIHGPLKESVRQMIESEEVSARTAAVIATFASNNGFDVDEVLNSVTVDGTAPNPAQIVAKLSEVYEVTPQMVIPAKKTKNDTSRPTSIEKGPAGQSSLPDQDNLSNQEKVTRYNENLTIQKKRIEQLKDKISQNDQLDEETKVDLIEEAKAAEGFINSRLNERLDEYSLKNRWTEEQIGLAEDSVNAIDKAASKAADKAAAKIQDQSRERKPVQPADPARTSTTEQSSEDIQVADENLTTSNDEALPVKRNQPAEKPAKDFPLKQTIEKKRP